MNEIIRGICQSIFSQHLYLVIFIIIFMILTYLAIEKIKFLRKVLGGILGIILLYFIVSFIPVTNENVYYIMGIAVIFSVVMVLLYIVYNKYAFNKEANSVKYSKSKKIVNKNRKNSKIKQEKDKKEVKQDKENYSEDEIPKMCPECGGELKLKEGKFGSFYGCTSYPDCKYTYKINKKINIKNKEDYDNINKFQNKDEDKNICPECGGMLIKRNGKFGEFYGCQNYPNCKYIKK